MAGKSTLVISKDEFKQNLANLIKEGQDILNAFHEQLSDDDFGKVYKKYVSWNNYNREFVKQAFDSPDNEYLDKYSNAGRFNTASMMAASQGARPDSVQFRKAFFRDEIISKIEALENLFKISDLIPTNYQSNIQMANGASTTIDKIFISHSSKDRAIVEKIIDLMEA